MTSVGVRTVHYLLTILFTVLFAHTASAAWYPIQDGEDLGSQRISLPDNSSWRGRIGDEVVVVWKDGAAERTFTGNIRHISELYIKVASQAAGSERVIFVANIISLKNAGDGSSDNADVGKVVIQDKADETSDSKTTKASDSPDLSKQGVFILPMTGMVGTEFRDEEIRKIVKQADARGQGQVIVLDINSGGGYVIESKIINSVIDDACERHTVVAWIEHAISAASNASLHCDQIIFRTTGHTGGITTIMGNAAVDDAQLEVRIKLLEDTLVKKNRPIEWGRCLVREDTFLSATKDPETGEVTWYDTLEGEKVFSHRGQNLVFSSQDAVEYGFAMGIADTPEEVAELLQLNEGEWELAGNGKELNEKWVTMGERFTRALKQDMAELRSLGGSRRDINKIIAIYKSWIAWHRKAPNWAWQKIPTIAQLEKMIEDLKYQLRQMANGGGGRGSGGGGGGGGRGR